MDERKQKVLRAIIMDYISTAEPVGSRTIAKKYNLGVSSATIRNEMSDLEELGLIEQPHTSAGRIPSDKGYRYYVDHLMEEEFPVVDEHARIQSFFADRMSRLDQLYHETCKILSELSPYVTMVVTPSKSTGSLQHLQLISVSPFQAVLVLSTDVGLIHHRTIEFPVPVSAERLQEIGDALLHKLRGRSVTDIDATLMKEINNELGSELDIIDSIFDMMSEAVKNSGEEKVFLEGTLNILNQPEFRDVDRVKEVLTFLQQEDVLKKLLKGSGDGETNFVIGDEISSDKLHRCSMVTCTYSINGNTMGNIGILGPTRMEYAKSASLIRDVARELSGILDRNNNR